MSWGGVAEGSPAYSHWGRDGGSLAPSLLAEYSTVPTTLLSCGTPHETPQCAYKSHTRLWSSLLWTRFPWRRTSAVGALLLGPCWTQSEWLQESDFGLLPSAFFGGALLEQVDVWTFTNVHLGRWMFDGHSRRCLPACSGAPSFDPQWGQVGIYQQPTSWNQGRHL